ncbi:MULTISPECIES: hybrid sensor histidine kinase/response regulator transcription factor [Bacteroides]|uniref:hybrid sensor histidine kinase/response regulator transcription factor n=1 Tax=Bacteroides TaxID=816 RepID=UPI0004B8632B|nr:hybrid sensor histidine kinase/response regulator transcription factor [Bacteroides neonati]
MNNLKQVLIALFILLSQTVSAEYFKHIGRADGLSQLSIMSIYQDKLGRMWFGTREGICIYDGNDINTYKAYANNYYKHHEKAIIGNEVYAIQGNTIGDVFFIADKALSKYDIRKETFHKVTNRNTFALTAYEGNIWCVVSDSLFSYNEQTDRLDFLLKTNLKGINWLTVSESNFYIGSKQGLHQIDRRSHKKKCIIPNVEVYRIFESSQRELWIGCRMDGLYRVNPKGEVSKVPYTPGASRGIASNQIREFAEDKFHNIWFGTFDGLQKYTFSTGEYSLIKLHKSMGGLEHPSIFSLYKDLQGTIWIGSYYGGVNYFNPGNELFSRYSYELSADKSLYYSYIGGMAEDKRCNLWICTDGGGLSCMNRDTHTFTNFKSGGKNTLPHNNVKSICYDSKRDYLYIGTYLGGLSRYDIKKKTFYNYLETQRKNKDCPDNIIFQVLFWQDRLYIAARNGMFVLDPDTNEFQRIPASVEYCQSFDIDEDGFIWLTSWNTIIGFNLRTSKEVSVIDLEQSGCHFAISKVKSTQKGVYVGTLGAGVFYYDKMAKTVTNYSLGKGQLLSDYCYNLVELRNGNVLITGDKGVTLFSPTNHTFRSIGLSSGFPAPAIINGCGALVAANDEIFIGDVEGITSFREEDLKEFNENRTFYFSQLSVNNQEIYPGDESGILNVSLPFVKELNLKYDHNNLIISFALSNYVDILQNNQYEYKLEGFNTQWVPTKQMSLHYTNLDPGNYTLRIRAKGNSLNLKNEEISLQINISAPWYNTVWAWGIYLLIIGLCAVYYLRSQTAKRILALSLEKEKFEKQQIEQLNQAKLLFFTNVSHEFRTPLTLIISHIELILQNSSIPTVLYNNVLKINKHARQMRNLVSELLDFRKFEQDHVVLNLSRYNVVDFLREIYLSFLDYAQQRGIDYQFTCHLQHIDCWFDAQQMEKVFFNLLSNAFKYTPDNGTIEIIVTATDDICIELKDNGAGIEAADIEHVFDHFYQAGNELKTAEKGLGTGIGLALTKSIIEKHHSQITVESRVGVGSIFTIYLKRGKEHFREDSDVRFVDEEDINYLIPDSLPMESEQQEESRSVNSLEAAYTLLIVEDNEDLLNVLKQLFTSFYQVLVARNGKEGLEIAMNEKIDLIISDVMMPEMTGTEMCLQIKNNIDLCHIPIILLTALNTTEQNIEGLNRGADDYITKPFNAKILLSRCTNLIRNRLLIQHQFTRQPLSEIDLTTINPLDKSLLKKATQIIDENIDDPEFDIPLLCRELGMGRTVLYAKFKALTGMTPNNFILNHKLKCAAVMLRQFPDMPIGEIADRLGFGSAVYFSRCFKKQFYTSPQKYRKGEEE